MEYAMFLRGINVAGIKVPMGELRECLADLGLEHIHTYLRTGNVTFSSDLPVAELRTGIEEALTSAFAYEAHVLVLSRAQLRRIVAGYPFPQREDHHRYAVLCDSDKVVDELWQAGEAVTGTGDATDMVAGGERVVYWSCPKGSTLTSPFGQMVGRRRFRAATTTRNLNTLEKMV